MLESFSRSSSVVKEVLKKIQLAILKLGRGRYRWRVVIGGFLRAQDFELFLEEYTVPCPHKGAFIALDHSYYSSFI